MGLSLGWFCRHADVEVGMFGRVMDSIKGFLRKPDSSWNAWASISNVDIFQLERMWQPIVSASDRVREVSEPKTGSVFMALGNHDIFFNLREAWKEEWGEASYTVQVLSVTYSTRSAALSGLQHTAHPYPG